MRVHYNVFLRVPVRFSGGGTYRHVSWVVLLAVSTACGGIFRHYLSLYYFLVLELSLIGVNCAVQSDQQGYCVRVAREFLFP